MLFLLIVLFSIFSISASLGTFKPNSCVNIKTILNATQVNISTISSPLNSTILVTNQPMTKNGLTFNYSFCNTLALGTYVYDYYDQSGNVYVNDFTIGYDLDLPKILLYIFFLFLTLSITFFSIRIYKKHNIGKDHVKGENLYEMKKRNEFLYYIELLKQKSWIIGVFGVYFSIFIFFSITYQLFYSLGLSDLSQFVFYIVIFLGWGFVPFVLFWMGFLIISFYLMTKDILKYQFGGFRKIAK